MATSGTVATTTLNTAVLLEHAFRRVRILPAQQTPEMVATAKESLYMLLLNLANRGLNLWCVQSDLVGLFSGTAKYQLPAGTVDVLNVVYCQPTRLTGTDTAAATSVTTDLGSAATVKRVGLKFDAITVSETITLESSSDGITWTILKTITKTDWATDMWYWYELDTLTTAQYFRVSAIAAITVAEFYLASQTADLPVIQWNIDTWAAINNKAQVGRPSTNYYLERRLTPQLTLWPVPNNDYDHLQVFVQREVQDIGTLQQQIEVPQRWLEAITWQLAVRLAFEIPQVDPSLISAVQQMAVTTMAEAEREETDGAPIALAPNITVYTR